MIIRKILFYVLLGCVLTLPNISVAGVDLPWSTTFNCAEQLQPNPVSCDGVTDGPSWGYYCNSNTTYKSGIIIDANNPGGGGGLGARFWTGDGSNQDSGTLSVAFNSPQPELYIRWYFKYPLGYAWSALYYDKWLYMHTDQGSDAIAEPYGPGNMDEIVVGSQGPTVPPGSNLAYSPSGGWDTIMANGAIVNGHHVSDGAWHWAEVHIKMDTNGSNGIGEIWTEGVKRVSATNMNWGTKTGWTWMHFKSNQALPANGASCIPVYYDDMAIQATGPIGPVGNKPEPPTNLRVLQ